MPDAHPPSVYRSSHTRVKHTPLSALEAQHIKYLRVGTSSATELMKDADMVPVGPLTPALARSLSMDRPNVQEVVIANMIYSVGYFADGHEWNTGPCENATVASQRLELYRRGLPVSEAAPQQLSRRQLEAVERWIANHSRPGWGVDLDLINDALERGMHSDAWVWASVVLVAREREIPPALFQAGGTRVRRGPNGPIPIDAAGMPSLSREG